ncbi:acyl-CoA transferase [Paraburkholderia ginsengiterrae]|uniref:Acyl-CoA transferase n=2 Tax=Paraburkholderia ginsengiterrae TaxID=1462993 RepID=A0A1A9N4H7_9BURK|nr:acyl-CoA transferase [Paraburkholderia ginsengiterrae]OAJ61888.1 acyl-CoA transferase [Paraburkholderia ginsengiterrae]
MLNGARILACGSRSAVRMSARLLESAGASVDVIDPECVAEEQGLQQFQAYDAVIVSTDTCAATLKRAIGELLASGSIIVCNITATGPQSARQGMRWSDGQIQAITGLMDTTGFADGEPVRIGIPLTEVSAAMYAASSISAALRVRQLRGFAQNVDVTLFGCAVSALTTFLPNAFVGRMAGRVGNRHPSCAPWNAYRTRDGWVLICTSSEDQWHKLKHAARIDGCDDERCSSLAARVKNADYLDRIIEAWTTTLTTDECSTLCEQAGIAAGPIVSIDELAHEANFGLRHPVASQRMQSAGIDSETYRDVSAFRATSLVSSRHPVQTVCRTEERTSATPRERDADHPAPESTGPLAGIKVIEIGQYTTAPLVGKHLAAMGAQVTKVEPPNGETAREWAPGQGGTSYFFALNNTDKHTISADLKQAAGRDYLERLLATADVLVENLRPGALAKLGFDRDALARINPRLIYCSISGFGIESAYPSRPAFDTVIQATGGLMDLNRTGGAPVKMGVSGADILGGQVALFAVVSALADENRKEGVFLEIAMQDVAAWCSLFSAGNPVPDGMAIRCADGYVWLESSGRHDLESLEIFTRRLQWSKATRKRAVSEIEALGIHAVFVTRVDELIDDSDFLSDMLTVGRDPDGAFWPILKVPYRFSRTPAKVRTVPGPPESVAVDDASGMKSIAGLPVSTDGPSS